MRAVAYSTKVKRPCTDGEEEHMVLEIWIEELGICFNELNDAIRSKEPRQAFNHFGSIDIPPDFAKIIEYYIEQKETFIKSNNLLFDSLINKLKIQKSLHSKII